MSYHRPKVLPHRVLVHKKCPVHLQRSERHWSGKSSVSDRRCSKIVSFVSVLSESKFPPLFNRGDELPLHRLICRLFTHPITTSVENFYVSQGRDITLEKKGIRSYILKSNPRLLKSLFPNPFRPNVTTSRLI